MMQSQYVAHIDFLISCVINQQICVTKGESVYSTEEPVGVSLPPQVSLSLPLQRARAHCTSKYSYIK